MNLNNHNQNSIISSSSRSSIFDSQKPPTTNNFNQNSSLISFLHQIDTFSSLNNNTDHKQTLINSLITQKITIIYKQPNTISSHLNCPICYQVYSTPTRLYCGHTFCFKCLETIFDGDKIPGSRLTDDRTCPICRVVIDKNKIGKDLIAKSILQELIVVCPREECPWEGMEKHLENHFRVDCVFKKSQKQKPLWHSVFPQHAPKENVQPDPVVKGSLLARVYAKNKELHKKTSFQQLKQNLNGQTTSHHSDQSYLSKRQKILQKQKEKQSEQLNHRIQTHIKQLEQFEEFCRQKTPEQLQKEYLELERKKNNQKMQKRQKNIRQLKKILKQKQHQTLEENKKLQQKQAYLEKEKLNNIRIQQNFNLKLNCLQKLMSLKSSQPNTDPQDQHPTENPVNVQQISSVRKDNKNSSIDGIPPAHARGMFRKKPTFNEYMQKVKQKNHFQPYVQPKPSKEPPQIYDRGANSVKFTYNVGNSTGSYNPRYTEPRVIIPSENPNQKPSYMKKPNMYEATYQKHRLVRRPYVPPADDGKIPQKIPHRYFTSIDQLSDPEYLASDKANRKGQYKHLESTKKHIGVTNMKFKSY